MSNTETTPLPCPWCGQIPVAVLHGFSHRFFVVCINAECPVKTETVHSHGRTKEDAITAWNTRVVPADGGNGK